MKRQICLLGSTGSIGTQTLDVLRMHPDIAEVVALTAGSNIDLLIEQALAFQPKLVCIGQKAEAELLRAALPKHIQVTWGEEGLIEAAVHPDADMVITAVVGSVGLSPTLAAIEAGKTIGLANKETLVTAGHLVTRAAAAAGVRLLPIDSEHSAIFQALNGEHIQEAEKLILTASGGSFRDLSREQLHDVSVEAALAHPNWAMGAKITIDSATMANKGLEVIEAHWLFDMSYDRIDVVIHPESIIHSMVQYVDGSVIAQLGTPDMRVPIQYALTYPRRIPNRTRRLDFAQLGALHFRPLDTVRYPMVRMAYEAGRAGGTATTVFNAANEYAVSRFLSRDISFLDIEYVVENTLHAHPFIPEPGIEQIVESDQWARAHAHLLLTKRK